MDAECAADYARLDELANDLDHGKQYEQSDAEADVARDEFNRHPWYQHGADAEYGEYVYHRDGCCDEECIVDAED